MTFRKLKHSFVLIVICLSGSVSNLFSQAIGPVETSINQTSTILQNDNDFDLIPTLITIWEESNKHYFPDNNPYAEKRFNRINLNGRPLYYSDILQNPLYNPEKYPVTFQDTMIMDPMFLPLVFDGKLFISELPKGDSLTLKKKEDPLFSALDTMKNPYAQNQYDQYLRNKIYWDAILSDPSIVKYRKEQLPNKKDAIEPEPLEVNVFKDLFQVDNTLDFSNVGSPTRFETKRKYWFVNGSHKFQISEAYISKNWYKGGIGNTNLTSNQTVTVNYKKNKLQNNNEIKWNLSFFTIPDNPKDTLRDTRIGEDLFRIYSDFGFIAFGDKWSYSTNIEFKTQFFNNYVENANTKTAALFAPMFVNMGILGMKYQLNKTFPNNKYKTISVKADVSPLSVKYTYVRDPETIDPTRYGIEAGEKDLLTLGSLINSQIIINFNRGVSFNSRFKCFTDYEKFEVELENELNLAINRYFSTRIYLYARFDDAKGKVPDPKWGYWQINQMLTFGLNYKW